MIPISIASKNIIYASNFLFSSRTDVDVVIVVHCQVKPTKGTSLVHMYNVECYHVELLVETSSCDNNDTVQPAYALRTSKGSSSDVGDLIYTSEQSSFPGMWFPSGKQENDYILDLVVIVSDACGEIVRLPLNATVYVRNDSQSRDLQHLVKQILNTNGTKDSIAALYVVTKTVGTTSEAKEELINALAIILSTAKDLSVDILEPASQILEDITSKGDGDGMSLDTKVAVSLALKNVTEALLSTTVNGTDIHTQQTQRIVSNIVDTSSNLCGSMILMKLQYEEPAKDKATTILANLAEALDVVLDVAMLTLNSEEEDNLTLVTQFIEASVEKSRPSSLRNKQLTSKFGGFTLPDSQESGNQTRSVKFLSTIVNTHLFDSPDVFKRSPVVSMEINDEYGVPRPFDGIFTINITKTDVMAAHSNTTTTGARRGISKTEPVGFSFNLTHPSSMVSMTLESHDPSAVYGVYIREGLMANEIMHDGGWKIHGNPAKTVVHNATHAGTYFVLLTLEYPRRDPDLHDIWITVSVNICSFWNDITGEWDSEGCWPESSADVNVLICKCNGLPSFKMPDTN
ncbi:polycystin-1-like protein 2 [Ptychodera flava]|uniref:polycystin-1-like protein 2 n=1 Tax=Ptychodera flava TaxID=63121 RepID=UPI00396A098B